LDREGARDPGFEARLASDGFDGDPDRDWEEEVNELRCVSSLRSSGRNVASEAAVMPKPGSTVEQITSPRRFSGKMLAIG